MCGGVISFLYLWLLPRVLCFSSRPLFLKVSLGNNFELFIFRTPDATLVTGTEEYPHLFSPCFSSLTPCLAPLLQTPAAPPHSHTHPFQLCCFETPMAFFSRLLAPHGPAMMAWVCFFKVYIEIQSRKPGTTQKGKYVQKYSKFGSRETDW